MIGPNHSVSRRHLLACLAAGSLQNITLSVAQKEAFLLTARIVNTRSVSKGVTGTVKATLTDGTLTHDASIQVIDEFKSRFETPFGSEMNFKDSWKFNVAAYKLDRLLGLNMVPVTVERLFHNSGGSFTWWVDDVLMDEGDRRKKKIRAPDLDNWNRQKHSVHVFDQLIFNTDRNLGNLLIDKNWQIWMIDHSRCFRTLTSLREPKYLEQCDRQLIEKLRGLTHDILRKELGRYLTAQEISGLLGRRDRILEIFEAKGPSAVYSSPARPD